VWMHPELERVVTVNSAGSIVFPPVGEIQAGGLTAKQLGDRLADKITAYLRQTATVTVTVRDYLSHSIYVSGAVARPARIGFERIPSVPDVITAAGGALTNADLSRVEVVHQEGDQRHTLTVDVASVLRDGSVQNLPRLKPGDSVVVPSMQAGASAASVDGVSVVGEVARPGIYPAVGGQDLWVILASAGGPTAHANLRDVRIVTNEHDTPVVHQIDLSKGLERAPRTPYLVRPGDVVYVSPREPAAVGTAASLFLQLLQVTVTVLNVVVLVDIVNHGGHY